MLVMNPVGFIPIQSRYRNVSPSVTHGHCPHSLFGIFDPLNLHTITMTHNKYGAGAKGISINITSILMSICFDDCCTRYMVKYKYIFNPFSTMLRDIG